MKLPLEYNKLSEFFDVVGSSSANDVNRTVEKILKKYKVKTVLDLTCGTGSQVFWLTKHGYNVTGSDFSPPLLKIAKEKARKQKLNIKFLHGDMRNKKIGKFDAVITIFNAVGHLTKSGFEKAMRNIHKNLKPGGIYVFDIFNVDAFNGKDLSDLDLSFSKRVGNTTLRSEQYSKLDKKKNHLVSYDHFSVQESAGKIKNYKSKFALQIYTGKELRDMLVRNGFNVLCQYDRDGSTFSAKKTKEILTVARAL
ncbi:MAG TPA: class I SAM-dependent methyltransferase [Gammaproteobacteria bacterium]|nr:class I SAM-dependent methyltransferase [Gammaproteobacteria bacterium]